nr:hypothetical protein [Tanacetum cinerariifolium]
MTSFGYRSNPLYAIKECSSCGTLYTRDCGCSKGNVKDNILVPKPPKNYARCTRCRYLVDGPNCQGCAFLRQELEENLVTHSPDFQNTSEPSNASTNVVNAPRESYVVKQDHGSFVDKIIFDLNRAPDSSNQFHCFHCKDVLRDGEACKRCTCAKCGTDDIFCKRCTCKSCGKDAHIGYNCPSKGPVIYNPEPCNNQTIDEFPQTLPVFHPTFHSEAESPFTLDSTPTYVDESPNVFNPPSQPPVRVLLWRCLKIRVLWWRVLIDSSLVWWTVLIEIIALKTILVVVLLSRLMKSRWTHLSRNILTVLNEISDCCGLKLLDVVMEYWKIISSSSAVGVMKEFFISLRDFSNRFMVYQAYPLGMQLSAEDQKSLSEKKKEEEHLRLLSQHVSSNFGFDYAFVFPTRMTRNCISRRKIGTPDYSIRTLRTWETRDPSRLEAVKQRQSQGVGIHRRSSGKWWSGVKMGKNGAVRGGGKNGLEE